MKTLGKALGLIGLMLIIIPSLLIFSGTITIDGNKTLLLIGTLLWFIGAPLALKKDSRGA